MRINRMNESSVLPIIFKPKVQKPIKDILKDLKMRKMVI
jgi:hypothetical protein